MGEFWLSKHASSERGELQSLAACCQTGRHQQTASSHSVSVLKILPFFILRFCGATCCCSKLSPSHWRFWKNEVFSIKWGLCKSSVFSRRFTPLYFKLHFLSPPPSPPLFSTLCLMTASNQVFLKCNKKWGLNEVWLTTDSGSEERKGARFWRVSLSCCKTGSQISFNSAGATRLRRLHNVIHDDAARAHNFQTKLLYTCVLYCVMN
jgi:hypothetical protein